MRAYADGGGPTDIVGKNGLIVETDQELSELIHLIHTDREYARQLSHDAILRSREFDISRTSEILNVRTAR